MTVTLPVTTDEVKKILNLKNVKNTELFELHQAGVLLHVQRMVQPEHYLEETTETEQPDAARATAFKLAYAFLMLHSTVEFLNLNTAGDGIVESTGMDANQTKLLSTHSIEQKKVILERRALLLLKPYLNAEGMQRLTTLTQTPKKSFRATIV
jgi:hypothetical protein